MRRRLLKGTLALTSVAVLAVTGCGDDPAEVAGGNVAPEVAGGTDEEVAGGNLERYCELQRGLQSEGDAEKLDELAAVAPPEIAQEVGSVTEAYKVVVLESGDEHAAEAVAEQEAAMHAFNEERCGIPNPLEEE